MSYFEDNYDYLVYGPRLRHDYLSRQAYERQKKLKQAAEIDNRERALKNKVWRYWSSGINISSMTIEHLERAIKLCLDNPTNPRYDGFLPLLQERLKYKKSNLK
ncbi:hypothetical protein ED352_04505 [Muribaculaceae bacterium Isolate-002 (NCI)]|nr:hypothetical protein ED352_04505 [Muribaculaceae bacterium Isolate-002 (NCI)]